MVFVLLQPVIGYNVGLVTYSILCAVFSVPVESMLRAVLRSFNQHFGSAWPHMKRLCTRRVPVFAFFTIYIATLPLCTKGVLQGQVHILFDSFFCISDILLVVSCDSI
jgi:hypothetical protein